MADGKTAEEVARDLVDNCAFGENYASVATALKADIANALRQREQETAAECARLAELRITGNPRTDVAVRMAAEGIAAAIRSRFPKDAANG